MKVSKELQDYRDELKGGKKEIKMTPFNFRPHKTCIFGIQESGKTHWARSMYKKHFKKALVFQINDDDGWDKLKDLYVWRVKREDILKRAQQRKIEPQEIVNEEMKLFCKHAHEWAMQDKIDLIIFDEADLFFRNNYNLDFYMQDLVLNHRHFGKGQDKGGGIALWFITRRPQDIPTKVVETSKYLVVFKLEGYNAIQRFKEIHPEIPEKIELIDRKKHEFVFKELGERPFIHKALK